MTSFPAEERRSYDNFLRAVLSDPYCSLFLIGERDVCPAHSLPQYGCRGKSHNAPPPRRQLPTRGLQGIDDPAAEFLTTAPPRRLQGLVPVPFYRKSGPARRRERPHHIPPIRKASQRIRCLPPTLGAKRHRSRASCLTRSELAGIIPLNSYRNSRAIYSDKLNPASPKGAVPP